MHQKTTRKDFAISCNFLMFEKIKTLKINKLQKKRPGPSFFNFCTFLILIFPFLFTVKNYYFLFFFLKNQ